MRMNFESPQIFVDCVGYQEDYKPANCPTSGGTVPLFELAKIKKRDSPTSLKFQWWQILLHENNLPLDLILKVTNFNCVVFSCSW